MSDETDYTEADGPLLPLAGQRNHESSGRCQLGKDVIAAMIACLSALTMGFTLGYSSPALLDPHVLDILYAPSMVSWFSSLIALGALVGGPLAATFVERFGRKMVLMFSNVPLCIGWFMIIYASDYMLLYAGRILTGISIGMISLAAPLYIAEIATKDHRGMLGAGFQLSVTIGVSSVYALGLTLDWNWLAVVALIIATVGTVLLTVVPESPRWLVSHSRAEEAVKAVRWLTGFSDEDIERELTEIEATLLTQSDEPFSVREFLSPSVYKPLTICLGIMVFSQMSGVNAVIFYSGTIFSTAGFKDSPLIPSIIVAGILVLFTIISCVLMDRLGRRVLLITSGAVMTLSICGLAGYYVLSAHSTVQSYGWLSLLSVCVFIAFFSLGWGPIPWITMAELFPSRVRGVAGGMATCVNWAFVFIVTKWFTAVVEATSAYATFFGFGAFNLLGVVFVAVLLPETKGRTLEEIEQYFL